MIAEEFTEQIEISESPDIEIDYKKSISEIIDLMKQASIKFRTFLINGKSKKKKLNEDDFTQDFVQLTTILIRKSGFSFNVNGGYRDKTYLSKGISDFYFYPNEELGTHASFFSVESKRLPTPTPSKREKEYVIGDNKNGGIERYKIEKHGKGLDECGMIGFMEKENFEYWLGKINSWIMELSETEATWSNDELLFSEANQAEYCYLKSAAYTFTRNRMKLHHFWIDISAPMYSTQN